MNAIKLKFAWQHDLFHEITLLEKVRLLALNSLLLKSSVLKEYKIVDQITHNCNILKERKMQINTDEINECFIHHKVALDVCCRTHENILDIMRKSNGNDEIRYQLIRNYFFGRDWVRELSNSIKKIWSDFFYIDSNSSLDCRYDELIEIYSRYFLYPNEDINDNTEEEENSYNEGKWSCLQCIINNSFVKLGRDPERCSVQKSAHYCHHVCYNFTDFNSVLHSEMYFYLKSIQP